MVKGTTSKHVKRVVKLMLFQLFSYDNYENKDTYFKCYSIQTDNLNIKTYM